MYLHDPYQTILIINHQLLAHNEPRMHYPSSAVVMIQYEPLHQPLNRQWLVNYPSPNIRGRKHGPINHYSRESASTIHAQYKNIVQPLQPLIISRDSSTTVRQQPIIKHQPAITTSNHQPSLIYQQPRTIDDRHQSYFNTQQHFLSLLRSLAPINYQSTTISPQWPIINDHHQPLLKHQWPALFRFCRNHWSKRKTEQKTRFISHRPCKDEVWVIFRSHYVLHFSFILYITEDHIQEDQRHTKKTT